MGWPRQVGIAIIASMNRPLPLPAIILGISGLIPFFAMGYLALGTQAERAGIGLVAYGAVILSFLGAVHWGFALSAPDSRGQTARLGMGVLPSLVGWVAVLFTIPLHIDAALGLLIAGFVALTVMEVRARAAGLMPAGYMRLRYVLTAGVVFTLLAVFTLRLINAQIN